MKKNNVEYLENVGLKAALLAKLNEEQKQKLVSFSMDNIKTPNHDQLLIKLASMEVRNKPGAAFIASLGIANPIQLKELSPAQILEVIDEYNYHGDVEVASEFVNRLIIENQQEKIISSQENLTVDTLLPERSTRKYIDDEVVKEEE